MKNVVITGSTRGIGYGLAVEFLKKGCKVMISGRDQSKVDLLVSHLGEQFGKDKVVGLACEVSSAPALTALWQGAAAAFGQVDIWINNAGISIDRQPLHLQPAADLQRIVDTNLTAVLLANSIVLSGMLAQGSGQIWNMEGFGSNDATQPGMAAYGATKRAVTYLNKALQKEVKGTAVQVNTLSPGIVVTDLLLSDYDLKSEQWKKARKIFNILGDKVETVTPWLVEKILATDGSGAKVAWLTGGKAFRRFLTAGFNKRDLFADLPSAS
ncbi:SDR family NAD(P)-dependent oxidoreductase [Rheinheimera mangrovi]|jgi:short-subunit dehydrogenase|uniref:SDR family NAD(P)-dependent oxidoreductase n=1 Tax=Rheinheimera mangrovi TaxID=2498451 RepID=UPI000F8E6976|nr:SDR family oxidoreductase [Rheinheimera mangrovi]